jgi:cobalt-precorrin-5B (C1)-methyltransferase
MSKILPKNDQGLRLGYTTGSCSAAAAAAASRMLLGGETVSTVRLLTPKGIELELDVEQIRRADGCVRCGVRKDAGDDPDVTDGIYVYAVAELMDKPGVEICGGIGVGRVTRPGLEQPVGEAAINHVPREMIKKEVSRVLEEMGCARGIHITIEIPDGVELAARTFNPRLGIEGGISVLGTSGIVEPMSEEALKATIRAELSVHRAQGHTSVTLVPGNYGLDFLREKYGKEPEEAVKCSNFIGDALDAAVSLGFTDILLAGHIGKLIKLSGGIFQTHSSQADARMDLLVSAGVRAGISTEILRPLLDAVTTEDALRILHEKNVLDPVMDEVKKRIDYYIARRIGGKARITVILFSNVLGEL